MKKVAIIRTTHLCEAHKKAGAVLSNEDGWQLPRRFGNPLEEYQAARNSVALADRSHFGRLKISGKDALDLLNRLSSNKIMDLPVGGGTSTVLTTNKGRIIDLLLVINMDDYLLVITSPQTTEKVIEWIDLYTFSEDITIEDVTETTTLLSLTGPLAGKLLGDGVSALDLYAVGQVPVQEMHLPVIRTDTYGTVSYDILTPTSHAEKAWRAFTRTGAVPVGEEALEMLRVEQGVPRYSREMGEAFNPLEVGLDSSISYTKGCYIGQEVVLRLNTYKKVQKHLVGIVFEEGNPILPANLEVGGSYAGFLTSVVESPLLGHPIALGYLKSIYSEIDQEVNATVCGRTIKGKVLALPINKGSF